MTVITDTPDTSVQQNGITPEQVNELMSTIKSMQSKIEVLEKKDLPPKDPAERNKDPKRYSYHLWGGIPVLSYVSKKKDPTKDYLFKEYVGNREVYVENHLLEVTLASTGKDGLNKVVSIPVNEYNRDVRLSTKQEAQVISDGVNTLGYVFSTDDYGTITVSPNCIN